VAGRSGNTPMSLLRDGQVIQTAIDLQRK